MYANFFPKGHGNEFSNLIGSLRGRGSPAHGHGNTYVSFCPFVYRTGSSRKPFKGKSFYAKRGVFVRVEMKEFKN